MAKAVEREEMKREEDQFDGMFGVTFSPSRSMIFQEQANKKKSGNTN
jgi:hypothetical protein